MAATELHAAGTTAADSADFSVAAGSSILVYLKDAAGPDISYGARMLLQIKDGTEYFTVDYLTEGRPARVIQGGSATVTYRLHREACPTAVGAAYI